MKSPFQNLLISLMNPFISFNQIFNNEFNKQRRDMHFWASSLLLSGFFCLAYLFLDFKDTPYLAVLSFGWFGAWGINFAREWYREVRLGYRFDWLDIWAGCYGGLFASLNYLLIIHIFVKI